LLELPLGRGVSRDTSNACKTDLLDMCDGCGGARAKSRSRTTRVARCGLGHYGGGASVKSKLGHWRDKQMMGGMTDLKNLPYFIIIYIYMCRDRDLNEPNLSDFI